MRAYFSVDADGLRRLRDGAALAGEAHLPASEDEADEFDAMMAAAVPNRAVMAADVDEAGQSVDLPMVASFHVDVDGSGDLAWYAPDELDQVLDLLD